MKTPQQLEAEGLLSVPPYSYYQKAMKMVFNAEEGVGDLPTPHSDVYYVRYAMFARLGIWFSLDEVEAAMRAEGWNKGKKKKKAIDKDKQ